MVSLMKMQSPMRELSISIYVCICLSENAEEGQELTRMLNVLLSPRLTAKAKIEKLEKDFHIQTKSRLGKELEEMCNLSDFVEEIGLEKGIEQGRTDGRNLNLIEMVQKKYRKNKNLGEIAAELEEEAQAIAPIYSLVRENPDASCEEILEKLKQ